MTTLIVPHQGISDGLAAIDIFIIVVLLVAVFLVGVYASMQYSELGCFSRKKSTSLSMQESITSPSLTFSTYKEELVRSSVDEGAGRTDANDKYFLADRSMQFYFVGASLFASNIGSEHFIGQSGDGARRGLSVALYEWYAALLVLSLGWIFAPVYQKSRIYTTPEFFEYRYNKWCRLYLSIITCFMYVVTKMSASIYGGAVVLSSTLGWDLYWSAGICIVLSTFYTVTGGLRAVMYTDFLQMMVFVTGGCIVLGVTLDDVGGWHGFQSRLKESGKEDFWKLFRATDDPDYPWTGMVFGLPFSAIWYWCTDQDLVQRVLAAKDDVHTKAGCIMASMLKLLVPFLMVVPGLVVSLIYDLDQSPNKTDDAYPVLLTNLMPHGVIGMMIASIMTAMMSSLDSVFNAGSSIVTNDIYRKFYPNASPDTLVFVGRAATVGFAVLSFLWIPVLSGGNGLYKQLVSIQGYIAPPISVIVLLGITSKRINGNGALAGLLVGGVFGISRFIVSFALRSKSLSFPGVLHHFFYMNFQHFALFLSIITALTCFIVSLLTPAQNHEDIIKCLVQWNRVFAVTDAETTYPAYVRMILYGLALLVLCTILTFFGVFG